VPLNNYQMCCTGQMATLFATKMSSR